MAADEAVDMDVDLGDEAIDDTDDKKNKKKKKKVRSSESLLSTMWVVLVLRSSIRCLRMFLM